MLTPIQIFTSNLITSSSVLSAAEQENISNLTDNNGASIWQSSSAPHVLTISFAQAVCANALILHNTNAQSVNIEYKAQGTEDNFTQFAFFGNLSKTDILISFPSDLTAKIIRLTFAAQQDVFFAGGLNLCRKLISLDNALSSLRPSSYYRGGHHYLANGSLINWSDFKKLSFAVTLSNLNADILQTVLCLFKENTFLTYALYGAQDASFCRQFALSEPPVISAERKTALYQTEFTLLER